MGTRIYLVSTAMLISLGFFVFRIAVRRDYQRKGQLTPISAGLELLVWILYMSYPSIYNPPDWSQFWILDGPARGLHTVVGFFAIISGLLWAFGMLFWFGLRRAFGTQVDRLIQTGPYRYSRNPQLVGGLLLPIGSALQWPSWYALGWVLMYMVIAHMMVLTEEAHLREVFRGNYELYCRQVPRYLGILKRSQSK